jgi:L-rhamnonate dehydratase
VKWNEINQHFLAHPLVPEAGRLRLPTELWLGMALDASKIEAQEEL